MKNMHENGSKKDKAIALRKKGLSYKDILKEVPVAKSTLSNWLSDLPLTESEKHLLKDRQNSNISRGRIRAASALRDRRLERDEITLKEAQIRFKELKDDPFFQTGIALYWAEGAKRNSFFAFTNSDPDMMKVMVKWIERFLNVDKNKIRARLYLHKPYMHEECESFWSKEIEIPIQNFGKTVIKPTGLQIKKRPNYKGCLRLELGEVRYLRIMKFWQQMLIEYHLKQG